MFKKLTCYGIAINGNKGGAVVRALSSRQFGRGLTPARYRDGTVSVQVAILL